MPTSPAAPVTSLEVRTELVEALRLDLVGPWPGHRFEEELLKESPSRWYLTGYLIPEQAPEAQKFDPSSTEQLEGGGDSSGGDDDSSAPEKVSQKSFLPSSLGLSVLVAPGTAAIQAAVTWGDYHWEDPDQAGDEPEDNGPGIPEEETNEAEELAAETGPLVAHKSTVKKPKGYRRISKSYTVSIPLEIPIIAAAEKRQVAANQRYWRAFLENVDGDLIREFYQPTAHRVEPVGIACLWPVIG